MANIRGIVQQSTRVASRDGYGGHINFFNFWSDDAQAVVETAGYLNRRNLPVNYADGDVIAVYGNGFAQRYVGSTDAGTLALTLTQAHGVDTGGSGGAADGNDFITGGSLVGTDLTLTGTGGAGATIDLSALVQANTTMVNNGDGTFTFTNELGAVTVVGDGSVTTLVDNLDGTYTYTSEDGTVTVISTGGDPATVVSPASTDAVGLVGVSTDYARQDHKHPAQAPSADVGNAITTGADGLHFVAALPVAADAVSPRADDAVGTIGVSTEYAREDHKHPAQLVSADLGNLLDESVTDGLHKVTAADLISGDVGNTLSVGSDLRLFTDASVEKLFLTDTAVAPATAGAPTPAEALAAAGASVNVVAHYNGTDVDGTIPTYVWFIDALGGIVQIEQPGLGSNLFTTNLALGAARAHTLGGFGFEMLQASGLGLRLSNSVAFLDSQNGSSIGGAAEGIWMSFGAGDGLAIDGSEGLNGQMLASNGPNLAPTWDYPGKSSLFVTNTAMAPAVALSPTPAEALAAAGLNTDVVVYYNGTDIDDTIPSYAWLVDAGGDIIELRSPVSTAGKYKGLYSSTSAYDQYDLVFYDGELYSSNSNRTAGVWTAAPPTSGFDSFTLIPVVIKGEFDFQLDYEVGDLVVQKVGTSIGSALGVYRCISAHTAGNAPDTANWQIFSEKSKYRGDFAAFNEAYVIGDLVHEAGILYRCTVDNGGGFLLNAFSLANWSAVSGGNFVSTDLVNADGVDRLHAFSNSDLAIQLTQNQGGSINLTNYATIAQAYAIVSAGNERAELQSYAVAAPAGHVSRVAATPTGIELQFGISGTTLDLQIDNDAGTAGQVLSSNGPGAAPTWESITTARVFLSDTAVAPAVPGSPTSVEALAAAGTLVPGTHYFYNGTNSAAIVEDPTHVWYASTTSEFLRIEKPESADLINDQTPTNYIDIGNMRMQWGTATSNIDGAQTIAFTAAFGAPPIVMTQRVENNTQSIIALSDTVLPTTTAFTINRDDGINSTFDFYWFAVGLKP